MPCTTCTRSAYRSLTPSPRRAPFLRVSSARVGWAASARAYRPTSSCSTTTSQSTASSSGEKRLSSAEAAAADEPPGQSLLAEIRDQPRALEALLEHAPEYARTAAAIASRGAKTIRIVGHGSSD